MSYSPPTRAEAEADDQTDRDDRLSNDDLARYLFELAEEQRDGILAVAANRLNNDKEEG